MATTQQHEEMIAELEASGGFKILRKFDPAMLEHHGDVPAGCKIAMILDTETTGLDPEKDKIFELGYVLARYQSETGKFFGVIDQYNGLEDPGFPLPELIEQLTGVKYEDVKGQQFDRAKIEADIAKADLVIAHNSGFDRRFMEKEFPTLQKKPWACSFAEGPWKEMMIGSSKLEFLGAMVGGVFYDAHRALTDVQVCMKVLMAEGPEGKSIFGHVLDNARKTSYRIWAENSPFETKDILKVDGGYSWSDGSQKGSIKAWYKDVVGADLDKEMGFLHERVFKRKATVTVDKLTALERFSERRLERVKLDTAPYVADKPADPMSAAAPAVAAAAEQHVAEAPLEQSSEQATSHAPARKLGFRR